MADLEQTAADLLNTVYGNKTFLNVDLPPDEVLVENDKLLEPVGATALLSSFIASENQDQPTKVSAFERSNDKKP